MDAESGDDDNSSKTASEELWFLVKYSKMYNSYEYKYSELKLVASTRFEFSFSPLNFVVTWLLRSGVGSFLTWDFLNTANTLNNNNRIFTL